MYELPTGYWEINNVTCLPMYYKLHFINALVINLISSFQYTVVLNAMVIRDEPNYVKATTRGYLVSTKTRNLIL